MHTKPNPRATRPIRAEAAAARSSSAMAKRLRDFDVRLDRVKRQAEQVTAELQAMLRK